VYDSRHTPSERTELAAMDVFERAEARGERITLAMCVERLAELRSHRPCGRCGRAAAKAKPQHVFRVASGWQRWAAATGCEWPAERIPPASRSQSGEVC
jgi:hypothetical protein